MTGSISDSSQAKQFARKQYATAGNLNARKNLHARFSTNPYGWYRWYMDQLQLPAGARVLELGCGPADVWCANLGRFSASWRITLTDFSTGMLRSALQNLAPALALTPDRFTFSAVDAQAIPFPDASFDAVMANHMIYHLPDRALAIREMHRVLRPGGRLYAATNGENHMVALDALVRRLAPDLEPHLVMVSPSFAASFTLENGPEQLKGQFQNVELRRYLDALAVTEAQPLVDYVFSMTRFTFSDIPEERRQAFLHALEQEIQSAGAIRIAKDPGLLIAG